MRSYPSVFQFLLLTAVVIFMIVSLRANPIYLFADSNPSASVPYKIGYGTGLAILAGWLVFGILWRLLRVWKIRQADSSQTKPYGRLPRTSFYLILGTSVSVSRWMHQSAWLLSPMRLASANLLGMFVFLTGLGFAIWARWLLREFWSASEAVIRPGHQIIVVGPYRLVRHPIYTGEILMALGTGIWAADWVLVLLLAGGLTLYNLYRARTEELLLVEAFGTAYRQYQHDVPMIIPIRWKTR